MFLSKLTKLETDSQMQNAENEIRSVDITASRQDLGADSGSNNCSPVPVNDERMEPIAEENSPKSFDGSFSFVSRCSHPFPS